MWAATVDLHNTTFLKHTGNFNISRNTKQQFVQYSADCEIPTDHDWERKGICSTYLLWFITLALNIVYILQCTHIIKHITSYLAYILLGSSHVLSVSRMTRNGSRMLSPGLKACHCYAVHKVWNKAKHAYPTISWLCLKPREVCLFRIRFYTTRQCTLLGY